MGFLPFGAALSSLVKQADTTATGYLLNSSGGAVAAWAVPNDGRLHSCEVFATLTVSVLEVGGQVTVTYTAPGGQPVTAVLFAGALAVGTVTAGQPFTCAPNSVVTVNQATALTIGTAQLWAQIWGS